MFGSVVATSTTSDFNQLDATRRRMLRSWCGWVRLQDALCREIKTRMDEHMPSILRVTMSIAAQGTRPMGMTGSTKADNSLRRQLPDDPHPPLGCIVTNDTVRLDYGVASVDACDATLPQDAWPFDDGAALRDALWRHIPRRCIARWRRISPCRRVVTKHSLTMLYALTTDNPLTRILTTDFYPVHLRHFFISARSFWYTLVFISFPMHPVCVFFLLFQGVNFVTSFLSLNFSILCVFVFFFHFVASIGSLQLFPSIRYFCLLFPRFHPMQTVFGDYVFGNSFRDSTFLRGTIRLRTIRPGMTREMQFVLGIRLPNSSSGTSSSSGRSLPSPSSRNSSSEFIFAN